MKPWGWLTYAVGGIAIGVCIMGIGFALSSISRSVTRANVEDCDEAARRLRGTARFVAMPDGVHDLCIVETEGGTVPVQMR